MVASFTGGYRFCFFMADRQKPDAADRATEALAKRARLARQVGYGTLIPTMMMVGPTLGYLGGRWLEGRWGMDPWLSVGGLMLGFAAAIRQIVRMMADDKPRTKGPGE